MVGVHGIACRDGYNRNEACMRVSAACPRAGYASYKFVHKRQPQNAHLPKVQYNGSIAPASLPDAGLCMKLLRSTTLRCSGFAARASLSPFGNCTFHASRLFSCRTATAKTPVRWVCAPLNISTSTCAPGSSKLFVGSSSAPRPDDGHHTLAAHCIACSLSPCLGSEHWTQLTVLVRC